MLIGVVTYCILLWAVGRKIPGRLKRRQPVSDYKNDRKKTWIILIYNVLLAFLLILGFLLIRSITRGEL